MAFQKKTWVNRAVQYPLRRLLTIIRPDEGSNTMIADIQREEGEITAQGDAFSAANMNDLEDRIESAFNDAGGGAFVGVKYHASLVDYPGYPCWEDLTSAEKEKFDINNGATVNFLDDEAPSDIIGDTDISSIADGTLTGAVTEHEEIIGSTDISDILNGTLTGIAADHEERIDDAESAIATKPTIKKYSGNASMTVNTTGFGSYILVVTYGGGGDYTPLFVIGTDNVRITTISAGNIFTISRSGHILTLTNKYSGMLAVTFILL